ncbi:hypothetical protein [Candidatus Methanoperedens nitratireducens]|uniref:Uncharacterized protein n=1 Tax=Candidatus Methanoperedens nitratireducens TaxID=1392998 RepID=A0A284VJ60_9EURY|nr:hypothetical protein [Candidatus Methanoperedens nitroreducens]SNQ59283.1 hypothetical protein MNV_1120003 [Candidatus Methanoperedens nitroreducens]
MPKIIRRFQTKGQVEEVESMELDLPLSEDIIKKLNDNIRNAIEEKK